MIICFAKPTKNLENVTIIRIIYFQVYPPPTKNTKTIKPSRLFKVTIICTIRVYIYIYIYMIASIIFKKYEEDFKLFKNLLYKC